MGLVIEKTKLFPCVVVKETFQVTRGVASFQIQKMKLILFCRVPVFQRIWTPRSKSASGYGPPSADLEPPTKLSENIILNVLVKMDDTLRSSAY